ncbi:MAG TPA: hypothetical protein VFI38_01170 [Candidatus Acidoferrum sp.]|nr:hypothetical protein [Candidatus Acidoferrum sp.]
MRPLSQSRSKQGPSTRSLQLSRPAPRSIFLFTLALSLAACGGSGGGGSTTPPPPQITISIAPNSGTVLLGNTLTFSATVTNTPDTSVSWSVNGISGGSPQVGTISSNGLFTAPADLPTGGKVQVSATSHADSSKSSTAGVTISSDISVSLSPVSSSIELGALQSFRASITSSGKPDPAILWSLSGPACPNNCGAVDANGNYTAPAILPSAPAVTLIATSVADPSKQNSAPLIITSHFTLQLAAPSSLQPGVTAALVATLAPVPGSNPNAVLSWSLSGSGCSGNACGILTVITTQSAGTGAIADTADYTAPSAPPQPNTIVITVTPQADPSKKAQATIAIQPGPSLGLTPSTATLAANHRVTLAVNENGTAGASLVWTVNGIPGGNSTVGKLCVVASSPCQSINSGTSTQVDYIAPGAIPSSNPVSVQVAISGNPAIFSSAQITVLNHVLVSVFPNSVTLPPLGVQGFTASVLGTANQSVVWQVQGSACSVIGTCGIITPGGAFTAPLSPPAPNSIQIVAISQDDSAQTGSANVTISTGSNILSLHPASVYAGGANGFTLTVTGSGFVLSNPGPGSTLLINGSTRVTTCASPNSCSAPVTSTDVAQPGNVSVQIQSLSGPLSNIVSLVVVAPGSSDDVISLTSSTPVNSGKNITVVEPTTAGVDSPSVSFDLDVAALGVFNTSTNSCNLAGNPVPLLRPASGTIAADICLFSQSGFDTSMAYTISGPGDVAVISKQPAGLGIIHLTIQIPSTAIPGARTLFIQNANLDKTAASGALEIQ